MYGARKKRATITIGHEYGRELYQLRHKLLIMNDARAPVGGPFSYY
jgi:hypothetical protein